MVKEQLAIMSGLSQTWATLVIQVGFKYRWRSLILKLFPSGDISSELKKPE